MSVVGDLTTAIQAVCPIDGVYADEKRPKSEWGFWPIEEATDEQKVAAQAIIDSFDPIAWKNQQEAEKVLVTEYQNDTTRHEMINRLMTATPAQIDAWLSSNVTNLAQARQALGMILKILALIIRKVT